MKKNIIVIAILLMILAISLSINTIALSTSVTRTLFYDDIKINLNGQNLVPRNANGVIVEPFIIDGTTYLPVRAIASALGIYVDWDDETKTILLNEPQDAYNPPISIENYPVKAEYILEHGEYIVGVDIPSGVFGYEFIVGDYYPGWGEAGIRFPREYEHDFYENPTWKQSHNEHYTVIKYMATNVNLDSIWLVEKNEKIKIGRGATVKLKYVLIDEHPSGRTYLENQTITITAGETYSLPPGQYKMEYISGRGELNMYNRILYGNDEPTNQRDYLSFDNEFTNYDGFVFYNMNFYYGGSVDIPEAFIFPDKTYSAETYTLVVKFTPSIY